MTNSTDLVRTLLDDADMADEYGDGCCRGNGIVICAGGAVMLANSYVLVRVLRDIHKSELPIEIWHLGPAEMPEFLARIFVRMGCVVKDALSVSQSEGLKICDGWQLKVFALRHSSFEQVILLDADQVPLRDPVALFEWPEYRDTGAVFWPDVVDIASDNPIWNMLDLQQDQVRSWESGQMCINKKMHWRTICLVLAINERADTFYRFVYGDKDTFLLAWKMTGSSFALVPHLPFQSERFLVQRDFEGKPVFQHHTNCKWSVTKPNENLEGLKLFAECQGFLDHLAGIWNGHIFHAPPRSLQAQRIERELAARRYFSMERSGAQTCELELLPGHQIGNGRSHELANWYVDELNEAFFLVMRDRNKTIASLSRQQSGKWLGKRDDGSQEVFCIEPMQVAAGESTSPEEPIDLVGGLVRVAKDQLPELDRVLRLLAQLDPEIIRQIGMVAATYQVTDPALANHLEEFAAGLHDAAENSATPVRRYILDDPQLYVRP
ncbi:MAG: hypothetical protein ABJM26_13355 [Anderseniella sp.]